MSTDDESTTTSQPPPAGADSAQARTMASLILDAAANHHRCTAMKYPEGDDWREMSYAAQGCGTPASRSATVWVALRREQIRL